MEKTGHGGARALAELEVQNGLRQFDLGVEIIADFTRKDRAFRLTPSIIQHLQSVAVEGIESRPGQWRNGECRIEKSKHQPPSPHLIPGLIQEMCDYVNDQWHLQSAFHLSAYTMWRHNWIHPFSDGNGRTSRVLSFVVLCSNIGYLVPGMPTIPEQIQNDRTSYFQALEEADEAFREDGSLNVGKMEELLKNMLAKQLMGVIEKADGQGTGQALS